MQLDIKYPYSATAGSTLFYALLPWETSTNPTNLYVTLKKNSTLSNLLYTDTPHNRPAVSLLLIFSYNKSVCNVQVCTQLQKFFASTRKLAKTARLANFRTHCDFRSSRSHLQNLRELREITRWAIFHDTWDFRIFFFVMLKTNSKSSCGFYQICAAEIAKNRQPNDFSRYLRFLPFFFMLMIIKSKASCRPFFVVIGV